MLFAGGLAWLLDPASLGTAGDAADARILVWLVAAAVLSQSLANYYYGILRGQLRFQLLAKVTLISALAQLATAWVGSLLFGLAGALAAPVAGFIIGGVLAFRSLAFRRGLRRDLVTRSVNFAWSTWGGYFLTTVAWSRMEIFFLKQSWGDHAAGQFAAGLNLANLALQMPLLLTGAMIPFLVLKSKSDSHAQFAQSYADATRYFAMLVFPACFGAAAIAPALLPVIFGPSFAEAVLPAMILIAGSSMMTFITIVQRYAFAVERTRAVLWLSGLGAVLAVLSGVTLVPAFGTIGAAIGRAGAQAIVAAAMIAYAHHLGWRTPYAALGSIVGASLISAGVAAVIVRALPDLVGIAAAILAAVAIYVFLIRQFRIVSDDDHRMVERLVSAPSMPPRMRSTFALTAAWLLRR